MTPSRRAFLWWFLGGLGAFAITLALHAPLAVDGVPRGIVEHQGAPDAATVDRIHATWKAAGVYGQAHIAMISDLIFIGIYGVGCVLGGLYYRSKRSAALRVLGTVALVAGALFLVTDYGETIAQFIQLVQGRGSDGLAGLASSLGPTKIASWISAFLALVAALIVERYSTSDA